MIWNIATIIKYDERQDLSIGLSRRDKSSVKSFNATKKACRRYATHTTVAYLTARRLISALNFYQTSVLTGLLNDSTIQGFKDSRLDLKSDVE